MISRERMYNLVQPYLTKVPVFFGLLPLTQIHSQFSKGEEHLPWFLWSRLNVTKSKINITALTKNSSAQRYVQSQGLVSIAKYFLSWSSPVTASCHLTSME